MKRTKEEKLQRSKQKCDEWIGVYTRGYEMVRASGQSVYEARLKGIRDLNDHISKEESESPSEKMFFLDVKMAIKALIPLIAEAIERRNNYDVKARNNPKA